MTWGCSSRAPPYHHPAKCSQIPSPLKCQEMMVIGGFHGLDVKCLSSPCMWIHDSWLMSLEICPLTGGDVWGRLLNLQQGKHFWPGGSLEASLWRWQPSLLPTSLLSSCLTLQCDELPEALDTTSTITTAFSSPWSTVPSKLQVGVSLPSITCIRDLVTKTRKTINIVIKSTTQK